MAAATRGTAMDQDRSGAVSGQVPPIKSARRRESHETIEDIVRGRARHNVTTPISL